MITKGKLTPHQREVYDRLVRISRRPSRDEYVWVDWRYLGSKGGLAKLVAKGWVEVEVHYGPQGGSHPSYRPLIEEES